MAGWVWATLGITGEAMTRAELVGRLCISDSAAKRALAKLGKHSG